MSIIHSRALFSRERRNPRRTKALAALAALAVGIPVMVSQTFGGAGAAPTQTTFASSTQFDLTGFLQTATLDCGTYPSDSGDPARCGGTLMVNGQTVVVPAETIVILPASALTWAELFAQNPAGNPQQTGMALNDTPKPNTTYEFNVIGNRVIDGNGVNGCALAGGCDRYIAGLVHVSQQDLNAGAGYINYINYGDGSFEVGGQLGVQGTGSVVRINDPIAAGTDPANPTGRYTRVTHRRTDGSRSIRTTRPSFQRPATRCASRGLCRTITRPWEVRHTWKPIRSAPSRTGRSRSVARIPSPVRRTRRLVNLTRSS